MTKLEYLDAALGVLGDRLDPADIRRVIDSIPEQKLSGVSVQQLTRILPDLAILNREHPFAVFIERSGAFADSPPEAVLLSVIVVAFDYPGLFSTVAGILSSAGFETRDGIIITTNPAGPGGRRCAVDVLNGFIADSNDFDLWTEGVHGIFDRVFALFESAEAERVKELGQPPENIRPSGAGAGAATGVGRRAPSEVRRIVLEEVASALSRTAVPPGMIMAPMTIEQSRTEEGFTRFEISSADTPFFLYSLSTALTLHDISIESLTIRTSGERVLDTVDVTDLRGRPIEDERLINRIRLSILLSKQFTYFIDRAPDPLRALERFDVLVQEIGEVQSADDIRSFLASPELQRELAVILGTSDFLWEDFIRIQHENIIPMISSIDEKHLMSTAPGEVEAKLRGLIEAAEKKAVSGRGASADGLEALQLRLAAGVQTLNDFKNRESFLIDLDHILVKELDFSFLSRRLTALADAVVRTAVDLAWIELVPRYGVPRTAAGLAAEWAVFGLGKLGGSALGYASDIELLFVFSDNGSTDGADRIANRDFFERLFRNAAAKITARREGIFKVDLRLRPHGEDGPVAVKLQSFVDYFSRDGQAHSAERLALVRLRWIGGSESLGNQVSRIRDQIIYEEESIKISELRALRKRQIEEKAAEKGKNRSARVNAKFSTGTLVDLEYNVQILQVIHGRRHPELRVPGIHEALRQLSAIGTIDAEEADAMTGAYQFFRTLINGLRMLRGNAQDLFLPAEDDLEYRYLARRMGYIRTSERSEAELLRIDFETHSAEIRRFIDRHLGRDAIPIEAAGSVVDLILSDSLSEDLLARIMSQGGFQNPHRALVNLKSLAGSGAQRALFSRLIVLAWDSLAGAPDPDMALNNWEQFVRRLSDPSEHYTQLLSQPRRVGLLILLFGMSQFLSDTLIRNPDFFTWITDPRIVGKCRDQIGMENDLRAEAAAAADRLDWLNRLRRFRKREILRIGLRDVGLGVKIEEIMGEISFLARACCEVALAEVWKRHVEAISEDGPSPDRLVICGFGKLGGWELNYSSDIDLVAVYEPYGETRTELEDAVYTKVVRTFIQDLTDFTQEGQAYRVDFRLRPYGASGTIVSTLGSILEYYRNTAELWEIQALIKFKPVAGNLSIGEILLDRIRGHFTGRWDPMSVRNNIARMRELGLRHHTDESEAGIDVKNGPGGIRDIEFLVQGLQLVHCRKYPEILKGNTLKAIELLGERGILSDECRVELAEYYKFLRKIEHYLQLAEDRQLHAVPADSGERVKLARFLGKTALRIRERASESLCARAENGERGERESGDRRRADPARWEPGVSVLRPVFGGSGPIVDAETFFGVLGEVIERVHARYTEFIRSNESGEAE